MLMDDLEHAGDWIAAKVLGSGGFGVVTLWKNKITGESIAIKKCKWNLQSTITPKQRERWTSEVQMMKKFENDNIVGFCDIPSILEEALLKKNLTGLPLLSMEYCSLGNLRDVLLKAKNCCGLPEVDVVCILNDMSNAVMYLHKLKIMHRDVKPENIVLQASPVGKRAVIYKLTDLGYAKELDSATLSFVGTLHYLAPEIFVMQNYDFAVDYWSLGVTAFEISCGMRPFLSSNKNLMESYNYIKNKQQDIISIQYTHTGEIVSNKDIPQQNQLTKSLQIQLKQWFRIVLQFDSEKRYIPGDTFHYLRNIISTKIITVFSVCTYAFYSYEVDNKTLLSTVAEWIAQDVNAAKDELYLLSTKAIDSIYAADYYDRDNSDTMLFVFKRASTIRGTTCTSLSPLIKLLFTNVKTEFKCGTFQVVYAHSIFFIRQENKHLNALKTAVRVVNDFLNFKYKDELSLFKNLRHFLSTYLNELEFYNLVLKNQTSRSCKYTQAMKEFLLYITKLRGFVELINILHGRYSILTRKIRQLREATAVIIQRLECYDFRGLYLDVKQAYYDVLQGIPHTNVTVSPLLLKILSLTIKTRDSILNDVEVLDYVKSVTDLYNELVVLPACREKSQEGIYFIKDKLRAVMLDVVSLHRKTDTNNEIPKSTASLIAENIALRNKLQELLNSSTLASK